MSIWQAIGSFALLAVVLTIVPGMDTVLTLRTAISRGRFAGFLVGVGCCLGVPIWGAGAGAGASALLAASPLAYRLLALAGGAYMAFLGAMMIRDGLRGRKLMSAGEGGHLLEPGATAKQSATGHAELRVTGYGRWLLTGLMSNLLNPKVGVFYLATIPLFTPAGMAPVWGGLLLGTTHFVLAVFWYLLLAQVTHLGSRWLATPRAVSRIDLGAGTVIIAFAAVLIAEQLLG